MYLDAVDPSHSGSMIAITFSVVLVGESNLTNSGGFKHFQDNITHIINMNYLFKDDEAKAVTNDCQTQNKQLYFSYTKNPTNQNTKKIQMNNENE